MTKPDPMARALRTPEGRRILRRVRRAMAKETALPEDEYREHAERVAWAAYIAQHGAPEERSALGMVPQAFFGLSESGPAGDAEEAEQQQRWYLDHGLGESA